MSGSPWYRVSIGDPVMGWHSNIVIQMGLEDVGVLEMDAQAFWILMHEMEKCRDGLIEAGYERPKDPYDPTDEAYNDQ